MKRILLILAVSILSVITANAQFKVHQNGHVSFQSLTTGNGVQIDTVGRTSIEPNISTSYCRTSQTVVHGNRSMAWIVKYDFPDLYSCDRFYVLGNGDVFYGGSLYALQPCSGSGHDPSKGSQPIVNATEVLSGLTGYYFENHEFDGFVPDFEGNPEVNPDAIPGLMQDLKIDKVAAFDPAEVEEAFPEAVRHDPQGRIGVNYTALVPVLVEAVKEQQQTIESLQQEIANLKNVGKGYDGIGAQENSRNALYQNTPNPTNSATCIECYLDASASKAFIAVYDLNGLQLKEFPVDHQGKNTVTIGANEFKPGIYMYSLLVNGKLIDTKRMVITSK